MHHKFNDVDDDHIENLMKVIFNIMDKVYPEDLNFQRTLEALEGIPREEFINILENFLCLFHRINFIRGHTLLETIQALIPFSSHVRDEMIEDICSFISEETQPEEIDALPQALHNIFSAENGHYVLGLDFADQWKYGSEHRLTLRKELLSLLNEESKPTLTCFLAVISNIGVNDTQSFKNDLKVWYLKNMVDYELANKIWSHVCHRKLDSSCDIISAIAFHFPSSSTDDIHELLKSIYEGEDSGVWEKRSRWMINLFDCFQITSFISSNASFQGDEKNE